MPARWFRIAYAGDALNRLLVEEGLELPTLTAASAVRAMTRFHALSKPQHGEIDELMCQWGPVPGAQEWEFAVVRRMTRHDHPETGLRLALRYPLRPDDPTGSAVVASAEEARATLGYETARGRTPRSRGISSDVIPAA